MPEDRDDSEDLEHPPAPDQDGADDPERQDLHLAALAEIGRGPGFRVGPLLLVVIALAVVAVTVWLGEAVLDSVEAKRDQALERAARQAVEGAFRTLEHEGPAPSVSPVTPSTPVTPSAPVNPATPATDAACATYHACCVAYLTVLRGTEGAEQATIDATTEACEAIDHLRAEEDTGRTCALSLEILRAGVASWSDGAGVPVPDACR